jgi:uncharacterized membrane protein YuzA (DUF378 family)
MYTFQEILTYIIVGAASVYALYQLVKIIISVKNNNSRCSGCSGGCEIKKQVGL